MTSLFYFLTACALVQAAGQQINFAKPFTDWKLILGNNSTNASSSKQPFPDIIHLTANIYGHRINDDFYIVKHIIGEEINTIIIDEHENRTLDHELRSYQAHLPKFNGWGAITLITQEEFYATFYLDKHLYQVDYADVVNVTDSVTNLAIYRHDDTENVSESNCHASERPLQIIDPNNVKFSHGPVRNLNDVVSHLTKKHASPNRHFETSAYIDHWANCYTGDSQPHRISIGIVVDTGLYNSFGGNENAIKIWIYSLLTVANHVTMNQFNVYISLSDLIIWATQVNSPVFNRIPNGRCNVTIDQTLNEFSSWRYKQQYLRNSVWTLLTNCYPAPGTVGLSWISALCDTYYSTNVVSKNANTALTLIHELGHTFGAQHTFQKGVGRTGGIMDYGDGRWPLNTNEMQFADIYSKIQICNTLSSVVNTTNFKPFCLQAYDAACGNGIIEINEDCDDSTKCCQNCKFVKQCSNTGCCDPNTCEFLPTSTRCLQNGYCLNGQCKASICESYSGLSFCGINPSNTCRQQCLQGSICSDGYVAPDLSIADGAVCSYNGILSTCLKGQCIQPANITNTTTVQSLIEVANADVVGLDLYVYSNKTREECINLLKSGTISFDVIVYKSTPDGNWCVPKQKSSQYKSIIDNSVTLYGLTSKNIQLMDIDCWGNDLNASAQNSVNNCHLACSQNINCVSSLFLNGQCYAKSKCIANALLPGAVISMQ